MADVFASGSAWLERVRGQSMARTVSYKRGTATAASIAATVTAGAVDEISDEVSTLQTRRRDYLVSATDFAAMAAGSGWADASPFPLDGDRITDGTTAWMVAGDGSPPYRFLDEHRNTIRIHTVEVRT